MDEPGGVAAGELIALLSDPSLRKNLVVLAARRCRSGDRGLDFAHQAIADALETRAATWNRADDTFLSYLDRTVERLFTNWRRKSSTRRERLMGSVDQDGNERRDVDPHYVAARAPDPEEAVAVAERRVQAEARLAELEARLRARGDELSLAIVACEDKGVHRAGDQATKIECPIGDVYRARERIAGHLKSLLRAEQAREAEQPS